MVVAVIAEGRLTSSMTPEEIRAALAARNMSIRDLAEATGIQENYLTKSLGKARRRIQVPEMDAIKKVFEDPEAESGSQLRRIPLYGQVPAGSLQPAQQRTGRWHAVSDPETPPNAYALTVSGESMNLIVPNGATVVIDPDSTALWEGHRYVVQTEDGETTFKEFATNPARLIPCSDDDSHQEILIGNEPIKVLGRVWSYTLRDVPRRRSA